MGKYPKLYCSGQKNESFNMPILFVYIGEGLLHSFLLFGMSVMTFSFATTREGGPDNGLWIPSTAMYTYCLIVVSLKMAFITRTWHWMSHIVWWGSLVVWFAFVAVYCTWTRPIITFDMFGVSTQIFQQAGYWFGIPVIAVLC